MKLKLTVVKLTSIIFIICLFLELIIFRKISFLQTSNITFAAASSFLIISLFWSVLYSGAFDFFHYSMRKVTAKMRRNVNSEELENTSLSKSVGQGFKFPLKVGFILLLISIVSLIFFYFT